MDTPLGVDGGTRKMAVPCTSTSSLRGAGVLCHTWAPETQRLYVAMRLPALCASLFAVCFAILIATALWAWLGRPIALPDLADGRLECLSYTVAYADASPLDGDFAAPSGLMDADMQRLKPLTNCIRTYSSIGTQGDAVTAAAAAGIKVFVGIWIGDNDKANEKEITRALALAEAHPNAVRALVVGNEVLLRREMTGDRLARIIRSVKARSTHPVTYADIFEFWRRNPAVADAVDFMMIHVLPYWDDPAPVSIDEVQGRVREVVAKARVTFPDKDLMIGEIGWPSAGRTRGGAVPSVVNQARFIREFARAAEDIGLPYNIIEAVDQPWKRLQEGTVGGYWGVLDFNREAKFPLTGPVSEWPHWKWAAAFAALGAVWATVLVNRRGAEAGLVRHVLAALAGAVGATSLWVFIDQARAFAVGWHGLLWAGYLGGLSVMAIARVVGHTVGRPLDGANQFRWAVLAPMVVVALTLAIDGRHRDFLTPVMIMPALALVLDDLVGAELSAGARAGLAWMGIAFLLAGPFAVDAPDNAEAIAWALCCLALAVHLRPLIADELRRLYREARQ